MKWLPIGYRHSGEGLGGGVPLPVTGFWDNFDVYFSPILVNDLTFIIEKMIEEKCFGIFHVCGTGSISKYEFGKNLQKIFDIHTGEINMGSVEDFAFKARRSKNMGMSNEMIKQCLDISIRSPIESIKEFKRLYDSGYQKRLKQL